MVWLPWREAIAACAASLLASFTKAQPWHICYSFPSPYIAKKNYVPLLAPSGPRRMVHSSINPYGPGGPDLIKALIMVSTWPLSFGHSTWTIFPLGNRAIFPCGNPLINQFWQTKYQAIPAWIMTSNCEWLAIKVHLFFQCLIFSEENKNLPFKTHQRSAGHRLPSGKKKVLFSNYS